MTNTSNLSVLGAAFKDSVGKAESLPKIIPISEILIDEQVRTESFDGDKSTIETLAANIKEHGLQQPIVVRPVTGDGDSEFKYRLVMGERRVRAMLLNGETHIEAKIGIMDDRSAELLQFFENVERQDLTVRETSKFIQKQIEWLKEMGVASDDIRGEILKTFHRENTQSNQVWLSNMMSLANLGEAGQKAAEMTNNAQAIAAVARLEKINPAKAAKVVETIAKKYTPPAAAKTEEGGQEQPVDEKAAKKAASAVGKALIETANKEKSKIREQQGKKQLGKPLAAAKGKTLDVKELFPHKNENAESCLLLEDALQVALQSGDTAEKISSDLENLRDSFELVLSPFHKLGKQSNAIGKLIIQGTIKGVFAQGLLGVCQMDAILHGYEKERYDVVNSTVSLVVAKRNSESEETTNGNTQNT